MNISVKEVNQVNIVSVEGRIDINASEIIETVGWLLKHNKRKLVCNFEKVALVDYSGLSILAIAYKNVLNHKGRMKFCCVPIHILHLFKLVRLDSVFQIYGGENVAVKSFDERSPIQKMKLRRRFKRVDMHIDAKFHFQSKRKVTSTTGYSGRVMNLSGDGIFIYTRRVVPAGTRLTIDLTLDRAQPPIRIRGMVVWRADRMLQPRLYPGMGIRFLGLGRERQARIVKHIDKNLTRRSRNQQ